MGSSAKGVTGGFPVWDEGRANLVKHQEREDIGQRKQDTQPEEGENGWRSQKAAKKKQTMKK